MVWNPSYLAANGLTVAFVASAAEAAGAVDVVGAVDAADVT